jgi:Tol biopolymer transport system component
MDDMTRFEDRFAGRVRAFAVTGVRPVDSAAVARAVALGDPKRAGLGSAARRLGFVFDRRAWALLLVVGLLAALVVGALLAGARLFPQPPPLELRLAYELDGDIYLADWDGADPVRIVDGDPAAACRDMVPQSGLVSPDGLHIAYRSSWGDGCPNTVKITDLGGHLVASLPAGLGWDVGWSQDGDRIATWLPAGGIGVYGIDGARQAVVNLPDGFCVCGDRDPVWSPNGKSLLLPMIRIPSTSVVVELPIDGGPPRPVPTDDPRSNRQVAFSPDGARAAFIVFYEETGRSKLFVADLDGTEQQVLINSVPGQILSGIPVWSAASDRIAVVVNHDIGAQFGSDLSVTDVRTGTETTLEPVEGRGTLRVVGFSTEADRLLISQDTQGGSALWSVNTDGPGARLLVSGVGAGAWLTSSADSEGTGPP